MELQDSMMRRIGFVMIRLVFEFHVDIEAVEEEKGAKQWRWIWDLVREEKRELENGGIGYERERCID